MPNLVMKVQSGPNRPGPNRPSPPQSTDNSTIKRMGLNRGLGQKTGFNVGLNVIRSGNGGGGGCGCGR